ncbi:MAG: aldo/keto reductase [Clostridia bacterium]
MQYRTLGKTGLEVSALGFGLMRLPRSGDEPSDIDEDRAIELIHHAIDNGVNYLDTAYGYHGGESERLTAKVLKGGYRDRVHVMTKLPSYLVETEDDFERLLNEQMEKLDCEFIDVYLIHALNRERWDNVSSLGITEFLDRARADGRIGATGFSFHDDRAVFKEIVDAYDWDACLIQLNFMDYDYQAGVEGMRYAAERDMGIAVMEPLRGGKLAGRVPEEVKRLWKTMHPERTPAEWAFRWVCNHPEVAVVLSGMGKMEELEENLKTFEDALPNSLSDEELALIDRVRAVYLDRIAVGCTECGYCMPCPQGVNIPEIFKNYNDLTMYDDVETTRRSYESMLRDGKAYPACVDCGLCVEACPQGIQIPEVLEEAHEALSRPGD